MNKILPIGMDSFRKIRENNRYYIDKTLMIRDFLQYQDEVALITRPRRFGKTLNMTMMCEFFDITKDSRAIFDGLAIMDTEYAGQINTRPVIYFSFKDCKGDTVETLLYKISFIVFVEYQKYYAVIKEKTDITKACYHRYLLIYEQLINNTIKKYVLEESIFILEWALSELYQIKPILLIDEYDQPIVSSFQHGYHNQVKEFFSGFYGAALKGSDYLHQALLTGIQRIVKESIFSQLNHVTVYTVVSDYYAPYFGLNTGETEKLLSDYGLSLDDAVKQQYDGYRFGSSEVYNPWSILNYAKTGILDNYWINTSTNFLIRDSIKTADELFHADFNTLINVGTATVSVNLECSFIELKHRHTLWGLLINSGYATIISRINRLQMAIRIPNGEVMSEFMKIIADSAHVDDGDLQEMFQHLSNKKMDDFIKIYHKIVINCTSYFDATENAYHMLFLGMCISLNSLYKIKSNIESGYGRSDIIMESLSDDRPHIVIEFKQGEAVDELKEEALTQIIENKYYAGLMGEVVCLGIAHDKKRCEMAHKTIFI